MPTLIKTALLLALGCCACDSRSPLHKIPQDTLVQQAQECRRSPPSAPGAVIACENLRKECQRRAATGQGC